MPLITGTIDNRDGAAVGAFIGVSRSRESALRRVGHPVPELVRVRLQLDTGSALTGFLPFVFQKLGIGPFRTVAVGTPSTTPDCPHIANQYDVVLHLVSGTDLTRIDHVHAIDPQDFHPTEGVQGIIGRDVLCRCHFTFYGPDRQFRLAW
jgi:hypothetical protein